MAARADVVEILREICAVEPQLVRVGKWLHEVAEPSSLLVKHLMDKGDGNRSFAHG